LYFFKVLGLSIPHDYNPIFSNLLCSSLHLKLQSPTTIFNLYIHLSQQFSSVDLVQLARNVNTPMLILDDFNSWSHGALQSNRRGNKTEQGLTTMNLMLLKNGFPTHFSSHSSFTHVDLSLASPQIYHKCTWSISDNLHGNDRFPIVIQIPTQNSLIKTRPVPKYKTDLANWALFAAKCESLLGERTSGNLNQAVASPTKSIRAAAANCSIPQTKITHSIRLTECSGKC